jgi:hypothetical protein
LLLGATVIGTEVAVLGLRVAPEKLREVTFAGPFTLGGALVVGFGLAFSSGMGTDLYWSLAVSSAICMNL